MGKISDKALSIVFVIYALVLAAGWGWVTYKNGNLAKIPPELLQIGLVMAGGTLGENSLGIFDRRKKE